MANLDRRAILAGTAEAFAVRCGWAARDFRYKFATNLPATHPLNTRASGQLT